MACNGGLNGARARFKDTDVPSPADDSGWRHVARAWRLFDLTQSYGTAILIGAVGNVLGILLAAGLPRERARLQPRPESG